MSARYALIVDDDMGFCDMLRGAVASCGLEVVVSAEWNDDLGAGAEPTLVVISVEPPGKAGFGVCSRARGRWPGAPIVLTTAALPAAEMDLHRATSSGADAYLQKRTLTPEELLARVAALIPSAPCSAETAVAAVPELQPGPASDGDASPGEPRTGREAELEEEVKSLRWELDATRSAAQSSPFSRDFLRLSEVVAVKEREIVRLKKEVYAREHKIATGGRTAREASSRASAATREREADQAEIRRLRQEIQRLTTEAEQAALSLADERQQHAETRRQQGLTLAAHAEVLKQVQDDLLSARSAIEAELRAEQDQAVAKVAARWKAKLKRLRHASAHSQAILHDQLRDQQLGGHQALSAKDEAHNALLARAAEDLAAVRAGAERQRDELQRLHELSLTEALAGHAAAELRAEQLRAARSADEARFREERLQTVAASVAEWEGKLDELRRAHADAVGVLRRHFQEQLAGVQAAAGHERGTRQSEQDAALRRAAEEVAGARTQAARLDQETRQLHQVGLLDAEVRHAETLKTMEARLREEQRQAVATTVAEWAAKLDDLRLEHAGSFDALRRHSLEQLAALRASGAQALAERDAAHAEALQRANEDLAATRARTTQVEQEDRERHEQELTRVQAAHLESLAALDTRLHAEQEQAVAAAGKAWEQKLEQLRHGHAASVDALRQQYQDLITALQTSREQELARTRAEHHAALAHAADELTAVRTDADAQREELRRLHEQALADAASAHADAQTRADQEQRAVQRAAEARLREEQARAVAVVAAGWEGKLDELRRAHAASVAALRQHSLDQLETLQSSLAQELAKRSDEHQAALRRVTEELGATRTQAAQLERETREGYELESTRAEAAHRAALGALDARLRGEHDHAVAVAVAAEEARLEELRRTHSGAMAALRQEHHDLLATLQAKHEQALAQKEAEHEGALARLEQELATARNRAAHLRQEIRQRPEAVPTPLPATQAEALKVLEARLMDEREQALAAVVAEWKAKTDRLRRGHADSMAALRREHQDHVAAIESVRQQPAAKQRPLPFGDPNDKVVPITAGGERSR